MSDSLVLRVTGAGGMVVGRPKMCADCAGVGSLLCVKKGVSKLDPLNKIN